MSERQTLNLSVAELDVLRRLDAAQRDLRDLAADLLRARTMKRDRREEIGRNLNAVAASLRTVELTLDPEDES